MTENGDCKTETGAVEREDQSPELKEFLRSISSAQKMLSMYGAEHPHARAAIDALSHSIAEFNKAFERPTCVFSSDYLIINERAFASSTDSFDMLQRLRARGVVAITLVGQPSTEQIHEFLTFLNAEPKEVREEGGPRTYLRKRGVTRIVVTPTVYMTSDGSDTPVLEEARVDAPSGEDRVIMAAIEWLSKQNDQTNEDAPRVPVKQILSNPGRAAKLIREAITKLHGSHQQEATNEMAGEVVHSLKDLASDHPEMWDTATPEIRQAISKLPQETRPAIPGFTAGNPGASDNLVDINDVEASVEETLKEDEMLDTEALLDIIKPLFGARTKGFLSTWQEQLEPATFIASSAKTLAALLAWEKSSEEHRRMAHALAQLISSSLGAGDFASASAAVDHLVKEACWEGDPEWRSANAKAALRAAEIADLQTVVKTALEKGEYRDKEVAALLVETDPALALSLVDLLGVYATESFEHSLRQGLIDAGSESVTTLGRILKEGSDAAKQSAMEILVELGSNSSVRTIAEQIDTADTPFIVKAFELLPQAKIPLVKEICVRNLSHKLPEVRMAALGALRKIGDQSILPHVREVLEYNYLWEDRTDEKIAALAILGDIGEQEELDLALKLARHRSIFGGRRHGVIRDAAERAASRIHERLPEPEAKAA